MAASTWYQVFDALMSDWLCALPSEILDGRVLGEARCDHQGRSDRTRAVVQAVAAASWASCQLCISWLPRSWLIVLALADPHNRQTGIWRVAFLEVPPPHAAQGRGGG